MARCRRIDRLGRRFNLRSNRVDQRGDLTGVLVYGQALQSSELFCYGIEPICSGRTLHAMSVLPDGPVVLFRQQADNNVELSGKVAQVL